MPKRTRDYLLRYADEALNDLERAAEKIDRIAGMYGETHPEYKEGFEALLISLAVCHDLLKTMREKHM